MKMQAKKSFYFMMLSMVSLSALAADKKVKPRALEPVAPAAAPVPAATPMEERIESSLPTAQDEAIRVLLLASILAQKDYFPSVVRVPDAIREKYEVFRSTMTGGGPVVAGLSYYGVKMGYKALEKAEFTEPALNRIFKGLKWSADIGKNSWERVLHWKIATALGRSVSKSSKAAYQRLTPVFKIFFKKGSQYSLGAVSISGALWGIAYLARHNSREIMTSATARELLGYDAEFERKLNAVISHTAAVYSLEPFKQALLRNGIKRELMEQAVQKKFKTEDADGNPIEYAIDVVKVMLDNNLIDLEVAEAAERLRSVVDQAWGPNSTRTTLEALDGSLTVIAQVTALLESIVKTEEMPPEIEMQIRQRVANAQKTMLRLQNNLKN
jgi:hypothetical protein